MLMVIGDAGKSIVDHNRVPSAVYNTVVGNRLVLRQEHDLHRMVADDWYSEPLEDSIQDRNGKTMDNDREEH